MVGTSTQRIVKLIFEAPSGRHISNTFLFLATEAANRRFLEFFHSILEVKKVREVFGNLKSCQTHLQYLKWQKRSASATYDLWRTVNLLLGSSVDENISRCVSVTIRSGSLSWKVHCNSWNFNPENWSLSWKVHCNGWIFNPENCQIPLRSSKWSINFKHIVRSCNSQIFEVLPFNTWSGMSTWLNPSNSSLPSERSCDSTDPRGSANCQFLIRMHAVMARLSAGLTNGHPLIWWLGRNKENNTGNGDNQEAMSRPLAS